MKSLTESIYYKCPVFLQNIAVSLLGLKLKRERFNTAGDHMLEALEKSKLYSKEDILVLQNTMFVAIARHAIETTPFYSEWAANQGITSADITSLADIKKFPVIEKELIRENPQAFKSNAYRNQFVMSTSGTTGTPLTIYSDKDSRSKHYAFFSRLRANYGINKHSRRVTLFGRIILTADQKKPPFWRYDFFQRNLLMSSYHLNDENLSAYYKKLSEYKPQEIFAYPSSIFLIANYIVKNNLAPLSLKLIMTTAENLLPHQRTIISQAFNAAIVNQYGCTEMVFFCSDFSNEGMKFHPEHGLVEIVTNEGDILTEGSGELIATGFINYSMPIIRYKVGDKITLDERDASGKQQLADIAGRIDDVIYTASGTPVGRLDPIFKGGLGIECAQIYQFENGNIELRLVPNHNYLPEHGESLHQELIKRIGSNTQVKLVMMKSIQKEKNGKFRPVISRIQKPNNHA